MPVQPIQPITRGQQVTTFNTNLKKYLRKKYAQNAYGVTNWKDRDAIRRALIEILFGQKASSEMPAGQALKKFKIEEIQHFLELTNDLSLLTHFAKAVEQLGNVYDFNVLTRYVTHLVDVDKRKLAIYKWFKPLKKLGSKMRGKLENLAKSFKQQQKENNEQNPRTLLKSMGIKVISSLATIGVYTGYRAYAGSMPCVLGLIPLKHVTEIEIARSGKILKFRATGSIFLANQEGGKDAIRITGKLYKTDIFLLIMLWFLFIYGRGEIKSLPIIPGTTNVDLVRIYQDIMITDTSLQKPSYEYHRTFSFINRHFIIPNCYIETINFEDKLPLKDVIQYTIMLRTYEKQSQFDITYTGNEKDSQKGLAMIGIGRTQNDPITSKLVDFAINCGWRLFNASGFFVNEQEWKLGSATKYRDFSSPEKGKDKSREEEEYDDRIESWKDEHDNEEPSVEIKKKIKEDVLGSVFDTYYNVDATSIASVMFLSIMGAMK